MRYSLIEEYNIQNGKSATVSLWTQGCPLRCKGCHNQHTWNFNEGMEWNEDSMLELKQKLNYPFLKDMAILGGEPLAKQNVDDVLDICKSLKEEYGNNVKIFLWTGFKREDIINHEIWKNVDIIISGPFILSEKIDHPWYGSKNQIICSTSNDIFEWVGEGILVNRKGELIYEKE